MDLIFDYSLRQPKLGATPGGASSPGSPPPQILSQLPTLSYTASLWGPPVLIPLTCLPSLS